MRTLVGTLAIGGVLLAAGCKHEEAARKDEAPTAAQLPAQPAKPASTDPSIQAGAPRLEPPPTLLSPALQHPPQGLPPVEDSQDNPTTPEKATLGYMLFFDKRLSQNDSMACAGCHLPAKAWTDDRPVSPKVGGALNKRNAPTMLNLAYHANGYYWDGRKPTLEATCAAAWNGQLGADPKGVVAALNAIPQYRATFQRAFNEDATADNVPKALAAFLRSLLSGGSAWDRFEAGDAKAVSKEAQRGFEVFKEAGCALCHVPPLYSDFQYHNVGIGSDKPEDKRDHGRMDATKDPQDDGKFKTPSLRDVAKTGPYFHDGSVGSLEKAIELMANGGVKSAQLDEKLKPANLKPKDRAALRAFLESLTGENTGLIPPQLPPR